MPKNKAIQLLPIMEYEGKQTRIQVTTTNRITGTITVNPETFVSMQSACKTYKLPYSYLKRYKMPCMYQQHEINGHFTFEFIRVPAVPPAKEWLSEKFPKWNGSKCSEPMLHLSHCAELMNEYVTKYYR